MKKTAIVFPGQSSQYVGMGKELCNQNVIARRIYEEASDSLHFDMMKLCFEADMNELTKTENAQPAILTTSYAAYSVFSNQTGLEPAVMAGHSLGEITALTCAGSIAFQDAVRLVKQRGKLMQEAVPLGVGCMSAVSGVDVSVIEMECRENSKNGECVAISNYNSPNQIVISGHVGAVALVEQNLEKMGARVTRIPVSVPFHSPLMEPAAKQFNEELKKYEYNTIKYPVISNVTARPYQSKDDIIDNLTQQIVKPVKWQETMEYIGSLGVELAVEMSPKTVLKNIVRRSGLNIQMYAYDKEEDMEMFDQVLRQARQTTTTDRGPTVLTRCMAIAVCTKNSNWDNDEYQRGVCDVYYKIQKMQESLDETGESPSKDQMLEALEMLRSVFKTKRTPLEEQIERFNQVFDETGTRELLKEFVMPC